MTNGSTSTTMSSASSLKPMKSPNTATLDFIRQFARTYVVVKELKFGSMMMN